MERNSFINNEYAMSNVRKGWTLLERSACIMKLSLMVQVDDGGTCWRKCWQSITECLDLFDQIFISVNQSPGAGEDIALLQNFKSEKIHWICQNRILKPSEHERKLDGFAVSFRPEGHIFILHHDCILLREGILQVKSMDLREDEVLFGPFEFFSQDRSARTMIVHEFHRQDHKPMTKELFIQLREFLPVTYDISGLVMPAKILSEKCSWHLLDSGYFSAMCHLVHPAVTRIVQNRIPTVKVPFRTMAENCDRLPESLVSDFILYHLQSFPQCREYQARCYVVRSVYNLIRINPLRGVLSFFRLHFSLIGLHYCYPALFRLHVYMFILLLQKGRDFLKRRIGRG